MCWSERFSEVASNHSPWLLFIAENLEIRQGRAYEIDGRP